MKVKSLEIDGFGVWSNLRLGRLDEGLNVFHGPNEAGKTTLMQFMRSVFFGFSAERKRYLPPVHGGRAGGTLELSTTEGPFRVSRHDEPGPGGRAVATVAASDGARHGEPFVHTLLGGIDEPTFNNVFSIGLGEIQALDALGATEAAAMLFRLTAGLDRVSLVEVLRELHASRQRLLSADATAGRIRDLLAQRDRLRGELDELDSLTPQYVQIAGQCDALARDAEALDAERSRLEHEARALEAAIALRPTWQRRAAIDSQLSALDVPASPAADVFDRFDQTSKRLSRLRDRQRRVERRRRHLRRRATEITVNEPLRRQAPRIDAFREQESWIASLTAKVAELENERREVDREMSRRRENLGLADGQEASLAVTPGARTMAELRRAGRAARQTRQTLREATARRDERRAALATHAREIDAAMAAWHGQDARGTQAALGDAIDAAGHLVAELRRRVQLDERIEQFERHQGELETRSQELFGRQMLPLPVVIGVGAVFVLSAVMLLAGLIAPGAVGSMRWPLSVLGIVGVLVAMGMKIMFERSNTAKLDACQKQVHMLDLQLRQARDDRDALDRSLPAAGALRAAQLATAEKDLAGLQELMPLETRRQTAQHEVDTAEARLAQAETDWKTTRNRWNEVLAEAGWPQGLSPGRFRKLLAQRDGWAALARRRDGLDAELTQRRRELDALTDRVVQLATEASVAVNTANAVELLHRLGELVRQEETRAAQRRELQLRSRRLRHRLSKIRAAMRPLLRRRRACLEELNVRDVAELLRRREVFDQAAGLRRERQTLQAEIDAAAGGWCAEADLAACLVGATDDRLEAQCDALDQNLRSTRSRLNECIERRGQLKAQLAELAADRRQAQKRLELGTIDARLALAVRRWRVLAMAGRTLTAVKEFYEKQRQPETLREASEYFRRLTGGQYVRVWTPLGEDVLRVDDARGGELPVAVLSEGAREQLFLALRLALVACYGRRGVELPLVLDDVLVNFDTPRARAAASLLCDFARSGHQLLVFTCHEHILSLFQSLKVEARGLPNHRDPRSEEAIVATPDEPPRRNERKHRRRHLDRPISRPVETQHDRYNPDAALWDDGETVEIHDQSDGEGPPSPDDDGEELDDDEDGYHCGKDAAKSPDSRADDADDEERDEAA
jgi:uncharacterized protein YhaN